jgi:tricorn protease-like protein
MTMAVVDAQGSESTQQFSIRIVNERLIGFMKITPLGGGSTTSWICSVDPDGTSEACITDFSAHSMSWSPDQRQIAFAAHLGGQTDMYLMDADGTDIVRLTDDPAAERYPAFSPDGTQIAFARGKYSQTDIWVIDVDGTDPNQLTFVGRGIGGPGVVPGWSLDCFRDLPRLRPVQRRDIRHGGRRNQPTTPPETRDSRSQPGLVTRRFSDRLRHAQLRTGSVVQRGLRRQC